MYEWYYDKLQPYCREDNWEIQNLDADSFIFYLLLSLVEDLKFFKDDFVLSDFSEPSHELYSKDNENVIGEMELETAPELYLDEAVFLGSKTLSLIIKRNSSRCIHKEVQDHNRYALEVFKHCLENNENKYGINYSFRSNKHEITMIRQKS